MKCRPDMMGEIVTVDYVMKRVEDGRKATWVDRKIKPRAGWIVGQRTVYDGTIVFASYDEPSYFTPTRSHTCLAICFWPNMKPVLVPSFAITSAAMAPQSPSKRAWQELPADRQERIRNEISKDSKDWPRDEKGRFV